MGRLPAGWTVSKSRYPSPVATVGGVASWVANNLTPGGHTINVVFTDTDGNYNNVASGTYTATETVNPSNTTTTLAASTTTPKSR